MAAFLRRARPHIEHWKRNYKPTIDTRHHNSEVPGRGTYNLTMGCGDGKLWDGQLGTGNTDDANIPHPVVTAETE